jgi:MSHA biogenesis protein MshN
VEVPPLAFDDVPPLPPLVDGLRLAYSIETPVAEHPRRGPARAATVVPPSVAAPELAPEPMARVVRRDSAVVQTSAQIELRRAMVEIQQGNAAAAEDLLMNALARDAGNEGARQALAALLLDQRRLQEAAAVLEQGLAINPRQGRFAFALARMQADGRDYAGALRTLAAAAEGNEANADFQSLFGTVLQRLSRHAEAVEHYENALRASPNNANAWMGLGLSLDALQRRDAAMEAFRKALASGTLTAEARAYIEEKARQPR